MLSSQENVQSKRKLYRWVSIIHQMLMDFKGDGRGEAMAGGRRWTGRGDGRRVKAMAGGKRWPVGRHGRVEAMAGAGGGQWLGGGDGRGEAMAGG